MGHIAAAIRTVNGARASTDPDTTAYWGASGPIIKCAETSLTDITGSHSASQAPWYDGLRAKKVNYISAQSQYISDLVAYAQTYITNSIMADNPQPSTDFTVILTELIRQMKANTKTVNRCTVSASVAAGGSNVGTAVGTCSVTGRFGAPQEYAFAEVLVAKVTGDHNTGSTRGSEPLSISGTAKETDRFSIVWPDGSGVTAFSAAIVNPKTDASSSTNMLTNSDFEVFTVTDVPDNWSILVGTVTTHVKRNTANVIGGSSGSVACLELVCDGAALISIAQTFNSAGGTLATLSPATVYGFNFWLSADSAPAAGVFKVDLVDSTNTVINDDAGTANAVTVNLNTLTTSYASFSGYFRTPTNMPSVVKLRLSTPTAGTSGRHIYIDFGAFTPGKQVYDAGPYVAFFRGATDVVFNDLFNITISNNRGGVVQTFFEQAFELSARGLVLPSSGSPNIADSTVA